MYAVCMYAISYIIIIEGETCDTDSDEFGSKFASGRHKARIGMERLEVTGHDALLRRQEMIVGVAEVANGPFRRVLAHEVSENPTDASQSQLGGDFINHCLVGIEQQFHRVAGRFLHSHTNLNARLYESIMVKTISTLINYYFIWFAIFLVIWNLLAKCCNN